MTANPPTIGPDDQLTLLGLHLATLRATIAELKEAEAATVAAIRDEVGEARGEFVGDGIAVSVTYAHRFDPVQAARVITDPDVLAACSVMTVSAAQAKRVLPPAVYELCQKPSDVPTIKVRVTG